MVDFPAFQIAPGSRRGIVPNEAAGAFAGALLGVEPVLTSLLESLDRRRVQALAGPLACVRFSPDPLRVECRGTRRARATALDATNRAVDQPVVYRWSLVGPVGTLLEMENATGRAVFTAAEQPAQGRIAVVAYSGDREASAEADVIVLDELGDRRSEEGIPTPEFVDEPGASWRSRMIDDRWQVKSGHREYRAIADRPQLKLRYLAMLFAKEVVLRSSQDPRLERPLEQLVEVAAYADRNLAERRGRKQ